MVNLYFRMGRFNISYNSSATSAGCTGISGLRRGRSGPSLILSTENEGKNLGPTTSFARSPAASTTSGSRLGMHTTVSCKVVLHTFKVSLICYGSKLKKSSNCALSVRKWFTELKLLRQHYVKVHAAKIFPCPSEGCSLTFPNAAALARHLTAECGREFACETCGDKYRSHENLLTHGRRRGHVVDRESEFRPLMTPDNPIPNAAKIDSSCGNSNSKQTYLRGSLLYSKVSLDLKTGSVARKKRGGRRTSDASLR